ncbi:uncharacterized protein LOC124356327 [Homalodisca vitripennis]|uniref:uncharacterized protein LOC124356327 n=1 Tax=Homalodisca vitripennis TaxID=197043 RepID=UPI001EEBEC4E|nr:uncharacterized protein LOC124356327 [Homalodisca vitripennis]
MEFGRDVNFGCCCLSPKCSSILIGGICLVVCAVTTVLLCTELVALEYLENLHSVTKVKAEILNLMVFTGVLIFISLGGCCLAIALLLGVYKESTRLIFAWIVGTAASILVQFVAALVEVLGLEQPFRLYKFITMPFNIYFILIVHNYYSELRVYEDHKLLNNLNTQQEESS